MGAKDKDRMRQLMRRLEAVAADRAVHTDHGGKDEKRARSARAALIAFGEELAARKPAAKAKAAKAAR
jgi:hypothetical protein